MLDEDDNLSPEEKIKQLVQFQQDKKREVEDKKKEFDKKKKELEDLEKTREKEISLAKRKIQEKIDEIAQEEKKQYEEVEDIRKKREESQKTLEEEVASDKRNTTPVMRGYGDAVSELMQGNAGFYQVTNYNVVNRLEQLAGEVQKRPLSKAEQTFIETLQYHAQQISRDDFYKNKDQSNYLKRELTQIDFINKMIKDREKSGDYT